MTFNAFFLMCLMWTQLLTVILTVESWGNPFGSLVSAGLSALATYIVYAYFPAEPMSKFALPYLAGATLLWCFFTIVFVMMNHLKKCEKEVKSGPVYYFKPNREVWKIRLR